MTRGDLREVTTGSCSDLYYLDTGMYDTDEYGAVYVYDAARPAIVETGIGTHHDLILDALDELSISREDVAVIAPTHVHLDHAGGAGFLAEACPNAEVMVHEIGARHLVDPSRLVEGTKRAVGDQWEFYVEPEPVPEERVVELQAGDEINLGDHHLEVYHAPGHAPHQVVYYDRDDDALFTGDAAGIWVPERGEIFETSPPPNFDLEECLADLETVRDLHPEALLYTHFGPREYEVGAMDEYADVLTEWVERVEEKDEELGDRDAVVEFFADQTDMADVWGERKAREEAKLNVRGVLTYLRNRDGE
ncbi:MBL fold metallo-hydrolase [Halorussus salilacus]|uniref:MBL fold metallo-hydrolase n=1 Tax=Halorussus salilacus TaxID=2953750 RepID=UPI00209F9A42|nr:MBL fold metallo-hydrolase [Halorussus salilacus]USZ67140.1 MBL fold metallo-hydrolase [Halorussus salilacus]